MSTNRLRKLFKTRLKMENCVSKGATIQNDILAWATEHIEIEQFKPCIGTIETCRCEGKKGAAFYTYEHCWSTRDDRWLLFYLCAKCQCWTVEEYVPMA